VHPYTGKVNTLRNSKERLQVFASDYERETQIYCKQREANRAEKEKGKRTRYCDPVIQQAWEQSDSGKAFVAVLAAQGYFLARGRKRIVVVTPHQKTLNLRRHLPQTASAVFKQRMADLSDDEMPPVDDLSSLDLNRQIAEETVRKVNLREKHKAEMERLRTSYKSEARAEETRLQHKIDYHIRIIKRLRHKMDKATFWHRLFGRKKAWARQLSTRKAVIARVQKQTRERTSALITIYRHKVEQMRLRHQEELGTPLSRYLMPPGGESPGAPAPSAD